MNLLLSFLNKKSELIYIITVIAAGFSFRIIYLYDFINTDFFSCLVLDPATYIKEALIFSKEGLNGTGVIWRPPLYIIFLGFIFRFFNNNLLFALLIQVCISTANIFILYLICKKITTGKIAVLSALLYSINASTILFSAQFVTETLFVFFVLLTILLLIYLKADNNILCFISGMTAGCAAVTRPNIIPVLLFWLIFIYYKSINLKLKKILIKLFLYAGGITAVIAPFTIHNYIKSESFIPVSAIGGYNFFIGNNQESDGKTVWASENILKKLNINPDLPPNENQRLYFNQAFDFIKNNSLHFCLLTFKKIYYLVNDFEISSNYDYYYILSNTGSLIKFLSCITFGLLFPFSVIGYIWGKYNKEEIIPLIIYISVFSMTIIFFFVNARFRMPLLPFICLFAVLGCYYIVNNFTLIFKQKKIVLICFITVFFISNSSFFNVNNPNDTIPVNLRQSLSFYNNKKYESARHLTKHILKISHNNEPAKELLKIINQTDKHNL